MLSQRPSVTLRSPVQSSCGATGDEDDKAKGEDVIKDGGDDNDDDDEDDEEEEEEKVEEEGGDGSTSPRAAACTTTNRSAAASQAARLAVDSAVQPRLGTYVLRRSRRPGNRRKVTRPSSWWAPAAEPLAAEPLASEPPPPLLPLLLLPPLLLPVTRAAAEAKEWRTSKSTPGLPHRMCTRVRVPALRPLARDQLRTRERAPKGETSSVPRYRQHEIGRPSFEHCSRC